MQNFKLESDESVAKIGTCGLKEKTVVLIDEKLLQPITNGGESKLWSLKMWKKGDSDITN